MNTKKIILGLFVAALTFTSCSDDEGVNFQPTIPTPETSLGAYENGILITNEGGFLQGNASVSHVSNDLANHNNSIFYFHNNETPLGDTAQSIAFNNELAYIVVNASNKIEVVNRYTFESVATINTGLINPRYMAIANGKGYVTNWGDVSDANDDFIAVINLSDNTVSSTISVTKGPERILALDNNVYVSRGFLSGVGSNITIINATDDTTTDLAIALQPDTMVLDASNNIWIQCKGDQWGSPEIGGKLVKVNTTTNTVVTTIDFPTNGHPGQLAIEDEELYYHMGGDVYTMSTTATTLPTTSIITTSGYGFAVNNGKLYATDPANYSDPGTLKVFNLSDNSEIQSITVGVNPSGIYFN